MSATEEAYPGCERSARRQDLATRTGKPIMIVCSNENVLLKFLEGELNAEDDARILAHLEDCVRCQEHLDRLTGGSSLAGAGPPIETVQGDPALTVELPSTAVSERDPGLSGTGGDLRQPESTGTSENAQGPARVAGPGRTAQSRLSPAAGDAVSTQELDDSPESGADGAWGTAIASGADPATAQVRREPRPEDWPTIPGYDILQRLGEGGMGVVYKARHHGLKRLVALKMIRGGSQARADHVSRFRVEAEAVARLRHVNIIQIYDIGEAAGLPFVALELLDGGGLDDRLAGNPQPGIQTAQLMVTLAQAVQVAHQAGIVHRDLKPTNVLYTADGVPKITDFGLAKRIGSDDGQTESGQIMGSPSYMAPEQARGHSRNIGPRADVYALGAMLYEMLTGRPPFRGETPIETIRQVLDDDPVTPSRLVPRLPRDLETIALKCLHKDPAKRYQSAQALAYDLERYLRREPILARRTGVFERGAKWIRRRPVAAASLGLLVTAILGGFLGALEFQRLRNAADRQASERNRALQAAGTATILHAKDDIATNNLTDAEVALTRLNEKIAAEPRLPELNAAVRVLLDDVKKRQAEQSIQKADRARYVEFKRLRNEAHFHDTQFDALDMSRNADATRTRARAALALFAAPGPAEPWMFAPVPQSLLAREQADIAEGCYELLLTLAEAEPTPESGLRRLDEAARLLPPTTAYHLRRAACLSRSGDAAAAERERQQAEAFRPVTAFDHFLVGQERYKRQDFRAAIHAFSTALQLRTDHFWARCLWAASCLQLNQPPEAKSALDACIVSEPGLPWLYLLRGFASYQLAARADDLIDKNPAQARDLKAEAEFQRNAAAADYRQANELLEKEPNDELRYALYVNRGLLSLMQRDFENATADLEAAIRLNERRLEAYAALALIYRKQDRLDDAADQYSRAIALRLESPALYRDRAQVDLSRKDPAPAVRARALHDLEQAIELEKPDNPVLAQDHTNRGRLLLRDHRETEALAAWDAALKVVPDYTEAHRLRIDLLFNLKRYDDVIRSCDALITARKPTPAIFELRGLARAECKDFAGAIDDVTNAMALQPDRAALVCRRGWLYIVSDAPRLALHDFEAAIRLDPSIGDAYNGRGFSRLRLGEHHHAVADAEKALGFGEPTSHVFYNAARVYALAAVVAAAEARKKGTDTVTVVARYEDRATGLLRAALKRMPENQRASFWRDVVPADPALRSLRRRVSTSEG
jgi:eukaryotic-like serine/threonine-protein kinase